MHLITILIFLKCNSLMAIIELKRFMAFIQLISYDLISIKSYKVGKIAHGYPRGVYFVCKSKLLALVTGCINA